MANKSLPDFFRWLGAFENWYSGSMHLLALLAAIIGLVYYSQLSLPLRILALLAWFELLAELSSLVAGYWLGTNLFLIPILTIGESALLLLLYGRALQSRVFWRVAPWVLGALMAFAVLNSILRPDMFAFRPSLQVLANLLMLGLAALYFRKLLDEPRGPQLRQDPLFWVSAMLVLVALGDLLLSLFSNYLLQHFSVATNKQIWRFHTLLVAGQYLVYGLALWRGSRPLPVAAQL